MQAVSINSTQRLFVIPSSGGFSCLGFDVVFKRLRQYAQKLGLALPDEKAIGKLEQYQQYLEAERAFIATNPKETCFEPDTPVEVQRILERYRLSGEKLRLFTGDTVTGRDWLNEVEVKGHIGRSMGPLRVPLLCEPRATGGHAISTSCVLRIMDTATGRELYRHPKYQVPSFEIVKGATPGLAYEVTGANETHARFGSYEAAAGWIAFMRGEQMSTVPSRRVRHGLGASER